MEPEVISLPKSAIANYEPTKLGFAQPEDSAWVSVDEGMSYVLGYLAKSRFNGNPGLSICSSSPNPLPRSPLLLIDSFINLYKQLKFPLVLSGAFV
jgi:hypothetical protein